jgi:hypothetical protein
MFAFLHHVEGNAVFSDEFLYNRIRELTKQHLSATPENMIMDYGEPTDPNYHQFEIDVLERDQDEDGPYIQVMTALMCNRKKGEIGSVYCPLCCMCIIRQGVIEYGSIGNESVSGQYVAF